MGQTSSKRLLGFGRDQPIDLSAHFGSSSSVSRLATELQEMAGADPPFQTFESLASQVLKDMGTGDRVETSLPGPPLPGDAGLYAQGYLDQRPELQANRPTAPVAERPLRSWWPWRRNAGP